MLRIDLLPPGVRQARLALKLIPLVAGLVVILAVAVSVYSGTLIAKRGESERAAAQAEAKRDDQKAAIQKIDSEAAAFLQQVAPALQVASFCRQFETYNSRWPDIIEAIARYTWEEATLGNISITSNSVSVSTTVPDSEALARFLFNFERCRMPSEGGGTEPLWSKDSVSVKELVPVFGGPISVAASLGGFSSEGIGLPGAAAGAGLGGPVGVAPGLGAGPGGGGGAVQYQGGLLYVPPISLTVTGTLAKPIQLKPLGGAAPAPAAGVPGMGVPGMGVPGVMAPGMGPPPAGD